MKFTLARRMQRNSIVTTMTNYNVIYALPPSNDGLNYNKRKSVCHSHTSLPTIVQLFGELIFRSFSKEIWNIFTMLKMVVDLIYKYNLYWGSQRLRLYLFVDNKIVLINFIRIFSRLCMRLFDEDMHYKHPVTVPKSIVKDTGGHFPKNLVNNSVTQYDICENDGFASNAELLGLFDKYLA